MENKKFCPNCGEGLTHNDQICPNCGKILTKPNSIVSQIKVAAILVAVLGIILSFLILLLPAISHTQFTVSNIFMMLVSLIGTYISTVMVLGFAKLVENSDIIARK